MLVLGGKSRLTLIRVANYYQRIDSLRWTPYLDDCLQMLAEQKEHSTDLFLAQLVRLQLIVERVTQAPWNDYGQAESTSSLRAPSNFCLKALQERLSDFKSRSPPEFLQNRMSIHGPPDEYLLTLLATEILLLRLYSTELVIHEVALCKVDINSNATDFQRLDCLYTCLHAVKNWFDIFLSIPPARYVGVSMAEFTQMAHCMIALYRLSTFEWPDWDRGLVRNYASLSMILDQLVANFAQVKATVDLDKGIVDNIDVFSITSRTLNHIKTWWDPKVAGESLRSDAPAMDETMGEASMDLLDDAWLQDVFGTGPYRFESFG